MCGIIGVFRHVDVPSPDSLNLAFLSKRGPDHCGTWTNGTSITFGATRLAMVDKNPRSNQPFVKGDNVLIFNGEVYNHLDLRRRYCALESFETESDTETLLSLLSQYGPEILGEVNGMYALALYTKSNNSVLLARDILGKKPLYFHHSPVSLIFGSTLRSVQGSEHTQINYESIANFLRVGFNPTFSSPLRGIQEVPAGGALIFDFDAERKLRVKKKSSISLLQPSQRERLRSTSPAETQSDNNLREELRKAVEIRVRNQGMIGLSLSGGIDSTVIGILISELKINAKAFSVRWIAADKDRYNDDFLAASQIAKRLEIPFYEVAVETPKSLINSIDEYMMALEEPNNNATGLSMMKLYEKMSQEGIRCALTGDGADEILYGYDRYHLLKKFDRIPGRRAFVPFLNLVPKLRKYLLNDFSHWADWHSALSIKDINSLVDLPLDLWTSAETEIQNRFSEITAKLVSANSLSEKMSFFDLQFWLVKESNLRLDRVSMFHSIEARMPFQDQNLMKLIWGSCAREKIGEPRKKRLFDSFPELKDLPILNRKVGFVSPIGHWMRQNMDEVKEEMASLFQDGHLLQKIDVETILISKNFEELKKLWTLLVWSRWMRVFSVR